MFLFCDHNDVVWGFHSWEMNYLGLLLFIPTMALMWGVCTLRPIRMAGDKWGLFGNFGAQCLREA